MVSPETSRRIASLVQQSLAVQSDFARFLGRYDFSAREISADGRVQRDYATVVRAVDLANQRDETNFEISGLGQVVSSLEAERRYRADARTQAWLAVVGVVSMGDFLYAWLGPALREWLYDGAFARLPTPTADFSTGLLVFSLLLAAGASAGLGFHHRALSRGPVAAVEPEPPHTSVGRQGGPLDG